MLPDIRNAICTRMTRQESIGQMHLAQYEVDRQDGNGDGEHETQGEQVESQVLAAEFHTGKNKGSQAADNQHSRRGCQHDDQAVAQHGPERGLVKILA